VFAVVSAVIYCAKQNPSLTVTCENGIRWSVKLVCFVYKLQCPKMLTTFTAFH